MACGGEEVCGLLGLLLLLLGGLGWWGGLVVGRRLREHAWRERGGQLLVGVGKWGCGWEGEEGGDC